MSRMRTLITATGPGIPAELERAWGWLEEQGYGTGHERELLTLHDAAAPDLLVFDSDVDLEGWFEAGHPARDELLPIAHAGDGSVLALWQDSGTLRAVVLGSEGDAYVLADSVADLLTFLAIGYGDLSELGLPPEGESVAAVAPFRRWVQDTFAVTVPAEWDAPGEDAFTDWVRAQQGLAAEPVAVVAESATTVAGEITVLLAALGHGDGAPELAAVAELAGFDLGEGTLGRKAAALRKAGIEISRERKAIATIFVTLAGYPRPDALIDGLAGSATPTEARAVLGEPEASGAAYLRYVVGGRYLHLEFADGTLSLVTLMTEAP